MVGKKKCRILREIRRKIADENDIPFVTEECRYKGDCTGTCPKCESELRYLERQLEKRRALGKKVTVSALALGLAASVGGCRLTDDYLEGDVPYSETDVESTAATKRDAQAQGKYLIEPEEESGTEAGPAEEEAFELGGAAAYEPESGYAPEDNANAPVYGPPETDAPGAAYAPEDNVEPNIYGPPGMMESVAGNG